MNFTLAQRILDFVSTVDPRLPGAAFRHSPSQFAQYCESQARDVEHRFPIIAGAILARAFEARQEALNQRTAQYYTVQEGF